MNQLQIKPGSKNKNTVIVQYQVSMCFLSGSGSPQDLKLVILPKEVNHISSVNSDPGTGLL